MSSRQYKWQQDRVQEGRCACCGKVRPSYLTMLCMKCQKVRRDYNRNKYRKKHGIPLNAPLQATGRRRLEDLAVTQQAEDYLFTIQ